MHEKCEKKKTGAEKSMLNSTLDATLQNRTGANRDDEDGAENLFALEDNDQDELMTAQVAAGRDNKSS